MSVTTRLVPRDGHRRLRLAPLLCLGLSLGVARVEAQGAPDRPVGVEGPRLTLALRGVPVAEALDRFAAASGASLAFDPTTVGTARVFCQVEDAPVELMLRCIVREAGLDFYRLSSGTYVVIASVRDAPQIAGLVGRVVDAASGEPVIRARVAIDAAAGTRAVSDGGTFRFASLLPGRYRVSVQAIGYRPAVHDLDLAPGRELRWRVALDPLPSTLSLVEVTGLLPVAVAPSGLLPALAMDSLPPLMRVGGPLRAAAQQLGIAQRAQVGDLHIQGGEAGEHQLRLDGVPVFDPVSVARLFGAFAPLGIRQLTVHKAGFGVAHGSFTAGVIDLEHSLGAGAEGVSSSVDPIAASLRTAGATLVRGRPARGMLTVRRSLWDVRPEPATEAALHDWVRIDPLLLRGVGTAGAPAAMSYRVEKNTPQLRFLDVHGAGRLELGAFQSLAASFFVSRNAVGADVRARSRGDSVGPPLLDTRDAYAWRTLGGMLRHDWAPGARVQQSLRLRVSEHALEHAHHALVPIAAPAVQAWATRATGAGAAGTLGTPVPAEVLTALLDVSPADRVESNGVREAAFDAQWRIAATDAGMLTLGLEAARTASEMDLDNGVFRPMQSRQAAWRVSQFAEWQQQLPRSVQVEAGLRLTWVPTFASVYAEPRLAVRGEHALSHGTVAWRVASGVHRQFVSQFELPALGASAVTSGVRFWLPVDGSVRPAESYHAVTEVAWRHDRGFTLQAEAYHKWLTNLPALDFGVLLGDGGAMPHDLPQAMFVGRSRGRSAGLGVRATQDIGTWRATAGVDAGWSTRTFPSRFGERAQRTPWNEPLRVMASVDAAVPGGARLSVQARSVLGRAWAFRRAYYDLALSGLPVDAPGDDRLPAWHEVDASIARDLRIGAWRARASLSALNVLARANVLDTWLVPALESGAHARMSRRALGRQLLLGVELAR